MCCCHLPVLLGQCHRSTLATSYLAIQAIQVFAELPNDHLLDRVWQEFRPLGLKDLFRRWCHAIVDPCFLYLVMMNFFAIIFNRLRQLPDCHFLLLRYHHPNNFSALFSYHHQVRNSLNYLLYYPNSPPKYLKNLRLPVSKMREWCRQFHPDRHNPASDLVYST